MADKSRGTPWGAVFFALLGLVWCGWIAFPSSAPPSCASSGCALFRDFRIAGISLWWVGGAYFFVLSVACLQNRRVFARFLARTALLLDALLLGVMFFTAPCRDCLVVAAFFGLTYFFLRPVQSAPSGPAAVSRGGIVLLALWCGLFLGNFAAAVNEALPLWVMRNGNKAEVRLYFSPSCPSCRKALVTYGHVAALYPVMENEDDFAAILRLQELLEAGVAMPEALRRSLDPNEPVPSRPDVERLLLRVQLMRNKAAVLRQGFRALPLIQVNGMPGGGEKSATPGNASASSLPEAAPAAGAGGMTSHQSNVRPEAGAPDFLRDPSELGRCEQTSSASAAPCPDPAAQQP